MNILYEELFSFYIITQIFRRYVELKFNCIGILYSHFFTILPEHEECLRDILELKWHVSYEGRQLSRIKDTLRITGLKQCHIFEFEQRNILVLSNHSIDPFLNIWFPW